LITYSRYNIIEEWKAELALDKKTFESLVLIIEQNINNDNFYNEYKKLKKNLIEETLACNEALNARMQQPTWRLPKNRKLAF
ncbi:2575_t:CDS:1, partial [Cetraspora pellucida]